MKTAKMIVSLFTMIAGLAASANAAPNPSSIQAFQILARSTGGHELLCASNKELPGKFGLRVVGRNINVRGQDFRGSKYSVAGLNHNSANLNIALMNDTDGPLATDVLILPINELVQLPRNPASRISGWHSYREGYDGTHRTVSMVCVLRK